MKTTRLGPSYIVAWLLVGVALGALVEGTYFVNVARATQLEQETRSFFVYVSEPASKAVTIADPKSSAVITTLAVGGEYAHFLNLPGKGFIYATAFGNDSGTLYVLSLPQLGLVAKIPVGIGAHHLDATPDGATVFVSSGNDSSVSEVSTRTNALIWKVNLGGAPQDVAFSSRHNLLLVANSGSDLVQAVNVTSGKVVNSISGLGKPVKMSIAEDQSYAVVTNEGSRAFVLLELPNLSVRGKITFSTVPHQLYLDSVKGYAYVGLQNGSLAVVNLDGMHVLNMLTVGGEPMDMQPSPLGNLLYVTAGDDLVVISTVDQSVVRFIYLGTVVHGITMVHPSTTNSTPAPSPSTSSGATQPSGSNASNFTCGG